MLVLCCALQSATKVKAAVDGTRSALEGSPAAQHNASNGKKQEDSCREEKQEELAHIVARKNPRWVKTQRPALASLHTATTAFTYILTHPLSCCSASQPRFPGCFHSRSRPGLPSIVQKASRTCQKAWQRHSLCRRQLYGCAVAGDDS